MFKKTMNIAGFDPQLAAAIAAKSAARRSTSSSSPRRTTQVRACLRRRAPCSPTNMRKATRASATTAAANTSTSSSSWPSIARSSFSAPPTRTCSRTRARRPMRRPILALIQPGDTILGMSLDHGGHLTHGAKVNFSGKLFRAVQYGIHRGYRRDRLRAGAAPRRGAQAAHGDRRLLGVFAHHRLGALCRRSPRASAPTSSSTWRTSRGSSRRASIRTPCRTRTS